MICPVWLSGTIGGFFCFWIFHIHNRILNKPNITDFKKIYTWLVIIACSYGSGKLTCLLYGLNIPHGLSISNGFFSIYLFVFLISVFFRQWLTTINQPSRSKVAKITKDNPRDISGFLH